MSKIKTNGYLKLIHKLRFISWDQAGAFVGLLCMVHCFVLPILISVFPFIEIYSELFEKSEVLIILSAILLASLSIYRGFFWHHHNKVILTLFIAGFCLLLGGMFLPASISLYLHTLAGLTLIVGHVANFYLCRECKACGTS